MISGLDINNFKCFYEASLRFRALTLLTGFNGSGKSTLVQAILLTRLACQSSRPRSVPLNGAFGLNLGEALDVLSRDASTDDGIDFRVHHTDASDTVVRMRTPEARARHLSVEHVTCTASVFDGHPCSFSYLSSERLGPREWNDVDAVESTELSMGSNGQFAAQLLYLRERDEVREPLLHPETSGTRTLRAQTEHWLSSVVRPIQLEASWPQGVGLATLRFREVGNNDWMKPANTGFGFTHALPIVLAGLTARQGDLLLIENPETHLHPAGQSAMGKFLARVASSGVQVIVETHSDHVINGVRVAVADHDGLASHDACFLFFDDSGPRELTLSPMANLNAWPKGFSDQLETDLGRLAELRKSRR